MNFNDRLRNSVPAVTPNSKASGLGDPPVKRTFNDKMKDANKPQFSKTGPSYIGGMFGDDTGFGESMFDDHLMKPFEREEIGIDELRAQAQPWVAKAGAGVGRALNSFATNVAEIPGFLVGSVAGLGNELFGDGENSMDMVVNNWWSEMIKKEQDWFNDDAMPVYVKKAVQEGNLWDNITSVDFWATEGADGAAFMAAALVPGYGLKALGTGTKLASSLGKGKRGLEWLKKIDKASKAMGVTNTAGATDVLGATLVNTIYEAGKEAQGAYEAYDNELNKLVEEGAITDSEYQELLAKKGEQASKVFRDNFGILLIPNLLMSKSLFGKFTPQNEAKKFAIKSTGEIIPELTKKGLKKKALSGAKLVGRMTAQEGFFEEGMQMTSEKYRTEDFLHRAAGKEAKSFAERYLDVVGSTEGQKAIFLGGFLGSIAGGVGSYRANKAEEKQQEALLGILKNGSSLYEASINGISKRDENGDVIIDPETNQPVKDQELVDNLTVAVEDIAELTNKRDAAIEEGNKLAADFYDNEINTNLIKAFVKAGPEGISLMKNYLTHSTGLDSMLESYNEGKANPVSKDEFINKIGKQAEIEMEDYEDFKAYGVHYAGLEREGKDHYSESFLNKLENAFISYSARDRFLTEKLNKVNRKLRERKEKAEENSRFLNKQKVLSKLKTERTLRNQADIERELTEALNAEEGKQDTKKIAKLTAELEESVDNQKDTLDAILNDGQYKALQKESEALTQYKKDNLDNLNDISNKETQRKAFDAYKKDFKEQESKFAQKEDEAVNEETDKIKKTKTKEDLKRKRKEAAKNKKLSKTSKKHVSKKADEKDKELTEEERLEREKAKKKVKDEVSDTQETNTTKKFNSKRDGSTEGGLNPTNSSTENKESSKKTETKNEGMEHTDVPLQDYFENDSNSPYNQWQENPRDKTGDPVEFRVATEYKPESTKALMEELHSKGVTDNVLENLPINVIVAPNVIIPINGKTDTDVWEMIDKPFRTKLLNAYLANGNSWNGISSTIAFQYGGQIQISEPINGKPVQNKLTSLKGFSNIDDIELLTPIDVTGTTINDQGVEGDALSSMLESREGEEEKLGKVYMNVKTANGSTFPLRLNIRNITREEAEVVTDLYIQVIAQDMLPNDKFVDILDEALKEKIVVNLQGPLKILTKGEAAAFNKLKIKDIVNFLIFEGVKGANTVVQYSKQGNLLAVGDGSIMFTEADIESRREELITWLTENKRHHIKFTKDGRTSVGLANKEYKKYLIDNGILNSNAVADASLFKGREDSQGRKKAFTFISSDIKAPSISNKKAPVKKEKPVKKVEKKPKKIRISQEKVVSSQKKNDALEQLDKMFGSLPYHSFKELKEIIDYKEDTLEVIAKGLARYLSSYDAKNYDKIEAYGYLNIIKDIAANDYQIVQTKTEKKVETLPDEQSEEEKQAAKDNILGKLGRKPKGKAASLLAKNKAKKAQNKNIDKSDTKCP